MLVAYAYGGGGGGGGERGLATGQCNYDIVPAHSRDPQEVDAGSSGFFISSVPGLDFSTAISHSNSRRARVTVCVVSKELREL